MKVFLIYATGALFGYFLGSEFMGWVPAALAGTLALVFIETAWPEKRR